MLLWALRDLPDDGFGATAIWREIDLDGWNSAWRLLGWGLLRSAGGNGKHQENNGKDVFHRKFMSRLCYLVRVLPPWQFW